MAIWAAILDLILPLLAGLLKAFVKNYDAQTKNDPSILDLVSQYVESAANDSRLDNDAKRKFVIDGVKAALLHQGKAMTDNLLAATMELVLQQRKLRLSEEAAAAAAMA
jgi:hypothetical protein